MFRVYDKENKPVYNCYLEQRKYQTLEYYDRAIKEYCQFENKTTFWELFDSLNKFIDLSDPDISLSNNQHLYQTAEKIRKDGHPEWLQVVGLIHDLGKIIYKKGDMQYGTTLDNQWGIVGDTFILGCQIPNSIVYPELNKLSVYHNSSKLGIYKKNCGLNNVKCSFGHDEYLYRLLKHNNIQLPKEAYYIIRFHSLYLWHYENEYNYFENDEDKKMKKWVQLFQKYDLYTKENKKVNEDEFRLYYESLIKKYFPNVINW